jgi:hypothetical protein
VSDVGGMDDVGFCNLDWLAMDLACVQLSGTAFVPS